MDVGNTKHDPEPWKRCLIPGIPEGRRAQNHLPPQPQLLLSKAGVWEAAPEFPLGFLGSAAAHPEQGSEPPGKPFSLWLGHVLEERIPKFFVDQGQPVGQRERLGRLFWDGNSLDPPAPGAFPASSRHSWDAGPTWGFSPGGGANTHFGVVFSYFGFYLGIILGGF